MYTDATDALSRLSRDLTKFYVKKKLTYDVY